MKAILGEKIRELRDQQDWKLRQVAEWSGISISHLSDIEHGRTAPSLETLDRISAAFHMDAWELLYPGWRYKHLDLADKFRSQRDELLAALERVLDICIHAEKGSIPRTNAVATISLEAQAAIKKSRNG